MLDVKLEKRVGQANIFSGLYRNRARLGGLARSDRTEAKSHVCPVLFYLLGFPFVTTFLGVF